MTDTDTIVFAGSLLTIGSFRCPSNHPAWSVDNEISDRPVVVFPRVPVLIRHAGGAAVIADPNVVMFYNARQRYQRALLTDRGDQCEFFQLDASVLLDVVKQYDPAVVDRPHRVFPFASGPSSARAYLIQRVLYQAVVGGETFDALAIEETFLRVLDEVVRSAYHERRRERRAHPRAGEKHVTTVETTKALLGTRMGDRLTLKEIATEAQISPFHLARVFRHHTGSSIHAYLNRLRLRTSLERIMADREDLTHVALALGYSSHSHFTAAFNREFGATPSAVRHWPTCRIREVTERLQ